MATIALTTGFFMAMTIYERPHFFRGYQCYPSIMIKQNMVLREGK